MSCPCSHVADMRIEYLTMQTIDDVVYIFRQKTFPLYYTFIDEMMY